MSTKKLAKDIKPKTVVANDRDDLKLMLRRVGGSQFENWNNALADQALSTLWVAHSNEESRDRQYSATVAALIGIGPKDEIEGMIAAQLMAAHNAAMECYRRAMIGEQTFEGRRDNLSQANKLSRTYKRQSLMLTSAPSALIWPDAVDLAASALEPKHFFEPVHAQIFAWLGDMRSRGQRTSAP